MKVYRLEFEDYGVFGTHMSKFISDPKDALYTLYGNTTPVNKWTGGFNQYRFACRTPEKLVAYFGSDFGKAIGAGAVVAVYEVSIKYVMFGYRGVELAFQADKAVKLT